MRLNHSRTAIAVALFAAATALSATTAFAAGKAPGKAAPKAKPAPAAPVPAPSRAVAGINLGETFGLKECPSSEKHKGFGAEYTALYDLGANAPCFKTGFGNRPSTTPANLWDGKLTVVTADLPVGFDRSYQRALIVDGKVEGLTLATDGLKAQEDVLTALTEKFGKPSKLDTAKVQNRMGAEFEQIDAKWNFSDLTVTFMGMGSKIDSGLVIIYTPVGEARELKDLADKQAAAPKL